MKQRLDPIHLFSLLPLGITALLLVAPFLGPKHYLPLATFHQEWLAAALGLAALLPLTFIRNDLPWAIPKVAALPLLLMMMAALQWAIGLDVRAEQIVVLSLCLAWASLLMLAIARLEQVHGRQTLADVLAGALFVGALLMAATGALQLWRPDIGLPWVFPSRGRVMGNIAQPNSFADYLWLGVAAACYLHARERLSLLPLLAGLTPLLGLSLLSGSRSVYFYAVALTGWLLLWSWLRRGELRFRLFRLALTLLPLLLSLQFLLGIVMTDGSTVSSAQRLVAAGSYDPMRVTLWRAALDMFLDHPLLGAGFDTYSREFFERIAAFPINGAGIPEHSHNLVTEFAAEFGAAGLVWLLACATLLLAGIRQRQDDLTLLAGGCLAILGTHSLLEYPLWHLHFLAIACTMLTVITPGRWHLAPDRRRSLMLGLVLVLGMAVLSGLRNDYQQLESAANGRDADGAAIPPETQQAWLLAIYQDSLWRGYADLQFGVRTAISEEGIDRRLKLVGDAVAFSPIRGAVFRHAALLQLAGRQEEAQARLRLAMLAYPGEIVQARKEMEQANLPALAPLIQLLNQRSF